MPAHEQADPTVGFSTSGWAGTNISTMIPKHRSCLRAIKNAERLVDSEAYLGPLIRLHPESTTTAATSRKRGMASWVRALVLLPTLSLGRTTGSYRVYENEKRFSYF